MGPAYVSGAEVLKEPVSETVLKRSLNQNHYLAIDILYGNEASMVNARLSGENAVAEIDLLRELVSQFAEDSKVRCGEKHPNTDLLNQFHTELSARLLGEHAISAATSSVGAPDNRLDSSSW